MGHFRDFVQRLTELALQSDRGMVLATALVEALWQQRIIVPPNDVIERICAEALTRGTRRLYSTLTAPLTSKQQAELDRFLEPRGGTKTGSIAWLRQPPDLPNAKHVLEHLERLRAIRDLGLRDNLERSVHQNRLLKLAREGGQTTAQDLGGLEPVRRYATLVAVVLGTRAALTDEIINLHDRRLGMLFNRAKRAPPHSTVVEGGRNGGSALSLLPDWSHYTPVLGSQPMVDPSSQFCHNVRPEVHDDLPVRVRSKEVPRPFVVACRRLGRPGRRSAGSSSRKESANRRSAA